MRLASAWLRIAKAGVRKIGANSSAGVVVSDRRDVGMRGPFNIAPSIIGYKHYSKLLNDVLGWCLWTEVADAGCCRGLATSQTYPTANGAIYDNVLYHAKILALAGSAEIDFSLRRHPMPDTVPVTIEVEPDAAAALADPVTRARLERLVRRTLRPTGGVDRLFAAMDALSDEAHRRGLTDEILEAELSAYNAERRDRPPIA